jgi:hypothetical protein
VAAGATPPSLVSNVMYKVSITWGYWPEIGHIPLCAQECLCWKEQGYFGAVGTQCILGAGYFCSVRVSGWSWWQEPGHGNQKSVNCA